MINILYCCLHPEFLVTNFFKNEICWIIDCVIMNYGLDKRLIHLGLSVFV